MKPFFLFQHGSTGAIPTDALEFTHPIIIIITTITTDTITIIITLTIIIITMIITIILSVEEDRVHSTNLPFALTGSPHTSLQLAEVYLIGKI